LVFLYKDVLEKLFEGVDAMRAQQSKRLPVVLSVEEMRKMLMVMTGEEAVMAKLLYGCGLRVLECLRLRVKDVDLSGGKELAVVLAISLREHLGGSQGGRAGAAAPCA
jgi:site-specific recombinase XerD